MSGYLPIICTGAAPARGPRMTDTASGVARTQKALGIWALTQAKGKKPFDVPAYRLIQDATDIELRAAALGAWPLFARPCPVMPRHGFVESRIVNNVGEAGTVFAEAHAADPQAEMILMRPIAALSSAVITPTSATFGPGHNGATQGREAITFPLTCARFDENLCANAGISETPYLETVFSAFEMFAVQLRNGPPINGGQDDRVPSDVTVGSVFTLDLDPAMRPDEMTWEAQVKAMPLDTVIYHPGGSQTSHYAVHAALRGLAVFTTRCPIVGETLKANIGEPVPYDLTAFRRGVGAGLAADLASYNEPSQNIKIGLLACHHALALRGAAGSWLLGYGAMLLVRYGITASCGEARYASRRRGIARSEIYFEALGNPLTALRRSTRVYRLFCEHHWAKGSAVGGAKWAECTKATIDLDYALRRAYVEGTDIRFTEMIGAMHSQVNQAHNGGWYLNKFCPTRAFDSHAAGDGFAIAEAAFYAYRAWREQVNDETQIATWASKRKARLTREGRRALKPLLPAAPITLIAVTAFNTCGNGIKIQYQHSAHGAGKYDKFLVALSPLREAWFDSLPVGQSLANLSG